MLDDDRTALAALIAALASHPAVPLTVVPSPETVSTLQASTATADRQMLDSMRASIGSREVIASPYVRDRSVGDDPRRVARRAHDPAANWQQTLAAALAPSRPDGRTWTEEAPLDARGLQGLRDAGVDQLRPSRRPSDADRPAVHADPPRHAHDGRRHRPEHHLHRRWPRTALRRARRPDARCHAAAAPTCRSCTSTAQACSTAPVVNPPLDWAPSPCLPGLPPRGLEKEPMLTPLTIDDYFRTVHTPGDDDGHPVVRSLADPSTTSLGSVRPRRATNPATSRRPAKR